MLGGHTEEIHRGHPLKGRLHYGSTLDHMEEPLRDTLRKG